MVDVCVCVGVGGMCGGVWGVCVFKTISQLPEPQITFQAKNECINIITQWIGLASVYLNTCCLLLV